MVNKPITQVVIVAAGSSTRAKTNKQFFRLKGKYLIEIAIEKFLNIEEITKIILVLSQKDFERYSSHFKNDKILITIGGKTRMESVKNGLKLVDEDVDIVMIHDGARPFVSKKLIKNILLETYEKGCVVPVIKPRDTIKEVENSIIIKTHKRERLFLVQTPQSYRRDFFKRLLENIKLDEDITDDSQILENAGYKVHTIEGEETNIKITTPLDLRLAEVIYEETEK